MTNKEWAKRGQEVLMNTFNRGDKVMQEGRGTYLKDADGKVYLDFLSGIAVNTLGHCPESIVEILAQQSQTLIHTSNAYWNQPSIRLAEKLTALSGLDKVFFGNSGAEANEGAIKLARKWGQEVKGEGAFEIISFNQSFHGRTVATLTATGQKALHEKFHPLLEGFIYTPFNDSKRLKETVTDHTCAVLVEVIQGEGGINMMTGEFAETLKNIQEKENVLLIIDEIQTGIGRTGTMFAYESYGFKPDIITLAKGLGGGVPISAFLATDEVAAHFQPGDHGSTFGGNPFVTAVGETVLEVIEEENLLVLVNDLSAYYFSELEKLQKNTSSLIEEVKGKGFLIGLRLNEKLEAAEVVEEAYKQGLLITTAKQNIIRLLPPLNVSKEELDKSIEKLEKTITAFA